MLHRVRRSAGRAASGGAGPYPNGQAAEAVNDLLATFIRLTPRDMSLTSIAALSTLDRWGPRRITDLAASEGVTQPSVTALVTALVREGYVERRSDPADKRVVMVAITESGAAFLRDRRALHAQFFTEAAEKLTPEQADVLADAIPVIARLNELVNELRGAPQPPQPPEPPK